MRDASDPLQLSNDQRERFRQVLIRQASRDGTIAEVAILARIDAAIAIATAEAAFTLMRRKNLLSPAELDRALADSYKDAADFLDARGRIAMPGKH
jgi:hypothetical protein